MIISLEKLCKVISGLIICLKLTHATDYFFTIQNEEEFQKKVIESDKPIIAFFYAHWCGLAGATDEILKFVIGEKEGRVLLARIHMGDYPALCLKYAINLSPTILVFKNGTETERLVQPREEEGPIRIFVNRVINEQAKVIRI